MEAVKEGDFVKHKTIAWMNGGKPFHIIKIENGKASCEYTGPDSIQYFHEFDIEQLIIVNNVIDQARDKNKLLRNEAKQSLKTKIPALTEIFETYIIFI